jgi:hypothetical protein
LEPNAVDCVLLIAEDYPQDSAADEQWQAGLPFVQLLFVQHPDFDWYVQVQFASDRDRIPKGMVEVIE